MLLICIELVSAEVLKYSIQVQVLFIARCDTWESRRQSGMVY